jgi:hypothetical protein
MSDNFFSVESLDAVVIDSSTLGETQPVVENSNTLELPGAEIINGNGASEVSISVSDNKAAIDVTILGEGPRGARGLSAYEIWLSAGHTGTEEDFLNSNINYVHPAKHSTEIIDETSEKQFISLADKLRLSGYIHDQIASSKRWAVTHTLKKYPSVTVVDSGDNLVIGDVEYLSDSQLIITFSAQFSGKAYLN